VLDAWVLRQIEDAFPIRQQHSRQMTHRQPFHPGIVHRCFDHHLVCPDAVHPIVESFPRGVEVPLDPERGEPIRHDTSQPSWTVRRTALRPKGPDLLRRSRLLPLAEDTRTWPKLRRLRIEVRWTASPLGRDDDPPPDNGIAPQLRHVR